MPSPLKGLEALSQQDMMVAGKTKDHPSIADYYRAQGNKERSLTYQHGLSNFSSVQLGDDRVHFKKSVSQDVYRSVGRTSVNFVGVLWYIYGMLSAD